MILLKDKENVDAPDSDYTFGVMRDDTGSDDGSRMNTIFHSDYTQFFEKMFSESSFRRRKTSSMQ